MFMMPKTREAFVEGPVALTLLGMSGVGKTTLSQNLPADQWFHYSGDYRIGTRYLADEIGDYLKALAGRSPALRQLLRTDSIHISHNITFGNLNAISAYLAMDGESPDGQLPRVEFERRQYQFREAEKAAMTDVPKFIERARILYGYDKFINDAGGSLCEIFTDPQVTDAIGRHTIIVYIRASETHLAELRRRYEMAPKPLYYDPAFLRQAWQKYKKMNPYAQDNLVDPDFIMSLFTPLLKHRIKLFEKIASRPNAVTLDMDEAEKIRDQQDLLDMIWSRLGTKQQGR